MPLPLRITKTSQRRRVTTHSKRVVYHFAGSKVQCAPPPTFLFHLGGIDCAVEIRHGLKDRVGRAIWRHASLGKRRIKLVGLSAVCRNLFCPKSKIAMMKGDIHIARFAADAACSNIYLFSVGIDPAIQKFFKQ
jgi:hypothetical protein